MLNAYDVYVVDVDEVRGAMVRRQILLFNLKSDDIRIIVPTLNVIYRHREALGLGVSRRHRGEQVGCESSDAALARQIIAKKRHLSNCRLCLHRSEERR